MLTPERMRDGLTELVTAAIGRAFGDWEADVGFLPELRPGAASLLHGSEELGPVWMKVPMVHLATRLVGELEGPLELYFPVDVAWLLVRNRFDASEDAQAREPGRLLDAPQLAAFEERALELFESFNTVYSRFGLSVSEEPRDLECEQVALEDATGLRGYAVMLPYELAGAEEPWEVLQVMPVPLARAVVLRYLGLEAA